MVSFTYVLNKPILVLSNTRIKGYAEIYAVLLPRTLNVFEQTGTEERTPEVDFLDLDVYGDLEHMPVSLRRAITGSLRVMHGYCEVFGFIITCLNEDRAPTSNLLDHRIRYSWGSKSEDGKLFLLAGGKSTYALQYLIRTLKELMIVRNGSRLAGARLTPLPICLNDTAYDLVAERLALSTNEGIEDMGILRSADRFVLQGTTS